MKPIIAPVLGLVTLLLMANLSWAQNQYAGNTGAISVSASPKSTITADVKTISAGRNIVLDSLAESNPKLKTAFTTIFPSAVQQQWGRVAKGYYVAFINNGRKSSAGFDVDGNLNYVISECAEEQLPASLRLEIRKNYRNYKLLSGTTIQAHGATAYQATLEGDKDYITLKSAGEEIEITQQINKTVL